MSAAGGQEDELGIFLSVPILQTLGQSELFQVLSVHPRRTTEPSPDEKHRPLVRHTSESRQQWDTTALGLQEERPLAFLPSG
jgi:hypothetical protein